MCEFSQKYQYAYVRVPAKLGQRLRPTSPDFAQWRRQLLCVTFPQEDWQNCKAVMGLYFHLLDVHCENLNHRRQRRHSQQMVLPSQEILHKSTKQLPQHFLDRIIVINTLKNFGQLFPQNIFGGKYTKIGKVACISSKYFGEIPDILAHGLGGKKYYQ